ncbi:hypothetical protein LPJ61_002635 [Coemansia biformis]|uniref:Uncharacterized protein n=1 Tax=Coemansia biformis TaxID=1286918 RepID=A0A9W7YE47_9FUNG|nr:hypothetical protein LPJ61_002635 [Coemansia biformis]
MPSAAAGARAGRVAPAKRSVSRTQPAAPSDSLRVTSPATDVRPIAAIRARRYALQAQGTGPRGDGAVQAARGDAAAAELHGLRRRRSGELAQQPAQTTAASTVRRVAPRIGAIGKQQSEPAGAAAFSLPPARRLRTTPSASDLGGAASQRAPMPELETPPMQPRALLASRPQGSAPSSRVAPKANTVRGARAASLVPRAGFTSGSVGRATHAVSPAAARPGARRPLPSPGSIGDSGPRVSYIPRLAAPVDYDDVPMKPGLLMLAECQEKSRLLALERETNNQLIKEIRAMATATESIGDELVQARTEASDAQQRAARIERELDEQRAKNAALAKKYAALETVVKAQAVPRGSCCGSLAASPRMSQGGAAELAGRHSSTSSDGAATADVAGLDGHWRDNYARMAAAIGAVRASYQIDGPRAGAGESTRRDLHILDEYLRDSAHSEHGASGARSPSSPRLFTPRQRRLAAQDERAGRRRSTMLFAGLIRPSGRPTARAVSAQRAVPGMEDGAQEYACGRCEQLQESLQAVVIDNSYYREANEKLRGSVADMVSSHNAMVRVFERERKRRRENRAHELAEASHLAARDRALLEARQRADLGLVDPGDALAERFGQALRIVSPAGPRFAEHTAGAPGSPTIMPV